MYIADLLEILCRKKRLSLPASDWVLCLADYSLAIPVDRTVASLEGQTDLALVRAQWAAQRGLRTGLRRGGDPNGISFFLAAIVRVVLGVQGERKTDVFFTWNLAEYHFVTGPWQEVGECEECELTGSFDL